jgi:hypothetical protein
MLLACAAIQSFGTRNLHCCIYCIKYSHVMYNFPFNVVQCNLPKEAIYYLIPWL